MSETEIIFEVSENELDGDNLATELGFGIHIQGDSIDELRKNVWGVVDCSFERR